MILLFTSVIVLFFIVFYLLFLNKRTKSWLKKEKVFSVVRIIVLIIPFVLTFTLVFTSEIVQEEWAAFLTDLRSNGEVRITWTLSIYFFFISTWTILSVWLIFTQQEIENEKLLEQNRKENERLKEQHEEEKARMLEIKSAIIHSPNPSVIAFLSHTSESMQSTLALMKGFKREYSTNEERRKACAQYIIFLLKPLLKFFSQFTNQKEENLSINVMLFIGKNGKNGKGSRYIKANKEVFQHYGDKDINSYDGVLINPLELVTAIDERKIDIRPVHLPHFSLDKNVPIIPGAPEALISGEALIDDTEDLGDLYSHFSEPEKEKAIEYFKSHTHEIKSLVSFAVSKFPINKDGEKLERVGVVNIHSKASRIINLEDIYIPPFFGIMSPLCNVLSKPIDTFRDLYLKTEI